MQKRRKSKSKQKKAKGINSNTLSNNTILGINNLNFNNNLSNQYRNSENLSSTNNALERYNSLSNNEYRVKDYDISRINFNKLRSEIKESPNISDTMFRYGMPTKLINDFLYSLYNENIICIRNNTSTSKKLDNKNFFMMMSVVELSNEPNTLYLTISEEPLTPTDENFYLKMGKLLLLIEIMLFNINYANNRIGQKFTYEDNNYSYANGRITILDIDYNLIKNISDAATYRNAYRSFAENYKYNNTFFVKKKGSAKSFDKYRNILPPDLKIKFVFNQSYIQERMIKGNSVSYRPFFKKDKSNPEFIACNSGSICSESKIFSYLHDSGKFKNVVGAIAYWLGKGNKFGKECHPKSKDISGIDVCNYHPNYAYEIKESGEDLLVPMIDILKENDRISEEFLKREKNKLFKNVFRAYALPCPGCYLNKSNYLSNKRIRWDSSKCLEHTVKTKKRSAKKMLEKAARAHDESDLV